MGCVSSSSKEIIITSKTISNVTIYGAYGVGKSTLWRQFRDFAKSHPNNKSNDPSFVNDGITAGVVTYEDDWDKETSKTEMESTSAGAGSTAGIGPSIDGSNNSGNNKSSDDVWHQFVLQLIELLSLTLNEGLNNNNNHSNNNNNNNITVENAFEQSSHTIDNSNTHSHSNGKRDRTDSFENTLSSQERKLIAKILHDFQDECCNEYSEFMLPVQSVPHMKYLLRTCDILYENYVKMSQTNIMDNFDYFVSKFLEMNTIQSFWDITKEHHDSLEKRTYLKTTRSRKREYSFRFCRNCDCLNNDNKNNNSDINGNNNNVTKIIEKLKICIRDKAPISTFRNVRIKSSRRYSLSKSRSINARNSFLRVNASPFNALNRHRSWSSDVLTDKASELRQNPSDSQDSNKPNVNRQNSGSAGTAGEASNTGTGLVNHNQVNGHNKLENVSRAPSMSNVNGINDITNMNNGDTMIHESNTMIFVVSLSDYNRFDDLNENKTINLLYESLQLFYDLCNKSASELNDLFHNLRIPFETNEFENVILFFSKTDQFEHKINNLRIPFDKQWVFGNKQTVGAPSNLSNNNNNSINLNNNSLSKPERKKLKKKIIYDSDKAKTLIVKKFKNVFEKGKITGSKKRSKNVGNDDTAPINDNQDGQETATATTATTDTPQRKKLYIWEGNALDSEKMYQTFNQFIELLRRSGGNDKNKNSIDFGFERMILDNNNNNNDSNQNGNTNNENKKSKCVTFADRVTWNIDNLRNGSSENIEIEMSRGLSITKDREPTVTIDDTASSMHGQSHLNHLQSLQSQPSQQSQVQSSKLTNVQNEKAQSPDIERAVSPSASHTNTFVE